MNCKNVKKELELAFEGKKPGAEALSHINSCKKCAAEYNAVLKITKAFSGADDVRVPAGFNKGVWDRIGEPAPSLLDGIFRPALVLGGAAAAALVVFLVFFAKPAEINKQDSFVSKPAVVKEKIAKKEIIKKQEQVMPEEAPALKQDNDKAPVMQAKTDGVSPGKMPVLVNSSGADREFTVKTENENIISAASVSKRPVELESPLVIKNNVIKPLAGQGMTILYKVEDSCNVLIRVYNRKGEPIKIITQAFQGRGVYTETWNGEDMNGRVVGDGIYLVHVKTCLTEQKIKAMVVK